MALPPKMERKAYRGAAACRGCERAAAGQGIQVSGFSDSEDSAAGLTDVVPFLIEDSLVANGGRCSKGADWHRDVVRDGQLVTGQNPASSEACADEVPKLLS